MFEITKRASFSAAHFLRGYNGPCARLHGHNWSVEVVIRRKTLDDMGMLIDFMDLQKELDVLLEMVDHHNLNEMPPFTEVNPTSENLAAWFHAELTARLKSYGAAPYLVRIWELPDCSAAYWEHE